jgi:hypothetical protein
MQNLVHNSEKHLRDHQVYRDSYMAASDWLGATTDKLNLCSDVRGDRSAIEAQLHKVQVKFSTVKPVNSRPLTST